ncbi:Gustatory receptor 54, partial [Hyalella azteca]
MATFRIVINKTISRISINNCSENFNEKNVFNLLLGALRILGLAPFRYCDIQYRKSQVYQGLSVALQIFVSLLTFVSVYSTRPTAGGIYESLKMCWDPVISSVTALVSWHVLISSTKLLKIVRAFNQHKLIPLSLRWSGIIFVITQLMVSCGAAYVNYALLGPTLQLIIYLFRLLIARFTSIILVLILDIIMKILAADLKHILASSLSPECFKFDRKEDSRKPFSWDLEKVKKQLMLLCKTVNLVQQTFPLVAFGFLACEQLNIVLVVLYAMYESFFHISVPFCFSVSSVAALWLITDSQTAYVRA